MNDEPVGSSVYVAALFLAVAAVGTVGASCALEGCVVPPPQGPPTVPAEAPLAADAYPDDEPLAIAQGEVCARAGRVLWSATCREAGRTPVDIGGGVMAVEAFPPLCRRKRRYIDADCIVAVGPDREQLRTRCAVRCLLRDAAADAGAP